MRSGVYALVALSLLGWGLILWSVANMSSPLIALTMPMSTQWSLAEVIAVWLMWSVMMGAMMLPSAIPMISVHRRIAAKQDPDTPHANLWFLAAYLLAWALFSIAATGLQWGFQRADVLSHMLMIQGDLIGGAILIAAGLFQLTPLKTTCLQKCRSPMGFLTTEWRAGSLGAFRMGLKHGKDCIVCCWGLMLVLFVGGVMNLATIAVISGIVAAEKLAPHGPLIARLGGALLIIWGLWLMFQTI